MQHVETFDCTTDPAELEDFLRNKLLPYWRSRGFQVKVYRTEAALGPSQYRLVTALDNFASIDSWPSMALAEQEGRDLMNHYLGCVKNLRGSVIKDIEA